jgi:hypothetical protein
MTLTLVPSRAVGRQNHVFVSYAREDATDLAGRLVKKLARNGIEAWNDKKMRPGVPFGRLLEQAIEESFAMVALISDAALDSHWVQCEWCYALSKKNITIIPVVVPGFDEDRFPIELFTFSRVYIEDYSNNNSFENVVTLVEFARDFAPK